jgi:hypothetical protein
MRLAEAAQIVMLVAVGTVWAETIDVIDLGRWLIAVIFRAARVQL